MPQIAPGVFTNQATQLQAPTGPNVQGGSMQFINNFNAQHPLMTLTPQMFNAANQNNSETAFQMLQQGGGDFRNAVMQANGWTPEQLNSWINQVGYENAKTFTPQAGSASTFAQFGSQPVNGGTTIGSLASGAAGATGGPVAATGATAGPGSFNSGLSPIAGTQPNYPLDVGSYLNPMMQYALNNGISTINNSAAAAGNLNSGNTMKELMDFGTGQASQNYNNAAQIAAGQQAFGYGVDNNDRNFAYNAMNNDRNFNLQSTMDQAGLGMTALGQISPNASILAQILSRNDITGGQAAAGGTIGGNNAIVNAIMQALGIGAGNLSASGGFGG